MSVRIFISCVSDEFRAYRDQLRHNLTLPDVEVKIQEDFKDQGKGTLYELDTYISACDVMVHLAGDMAGAAPKPALREALLVQYPRIAQKLPPLREPLERGEDISYTQWEAWLALYHDKRLLIAKGDDGAPRGPRYEPTDDSRAAQRVHLDRLRAYGRYPGCTFVNADQLANYVLSSPIPNLMAEERSRAERGTGLLPFIGLAIGILVLLVAPSVSEEWEKTLGVHVAAPLALILAVGGFALPFTYLRYFLMLGASDGRAGSRDRKGYDALRENLATGGLAVYLYSRWLTAILDRVDRFLGDAGMAGRTLFPHAFWLKTPAPLWTAAAFDRCLLLAALYPITAVFIMWAVSGHVGPAEEALGLGQDLPGYLRGAGVAAVGASTFAMRQSARTSGCLGTIWFAGAITALGPIGIAAPVSAVASLFVVVGFTWAIIVGGAVALASFGAIIVTFTLFAALASDSVLAFAGAIALPGIVSLALAWLSDTAIRNRWQGVFLTLLIVAMASGCLVAAYSLASFRSGWHSAGPLLLFLGLLTLLNAPFDWASLGLTRALLRRGLELKGWWPFALALVDALAAAVVIALLALTMVIGVQTFDALAVHGGGKPVLPLGPLFDGIAAHPELPEYWWVYALLLSTMIPSLINLIIGGTALTRALPGLPALLLHFLPARGGVRTYDRAWIAAVLTVQAALGAILGVAVQALVAWGLIFYAMPTVGLGLLDLAHDLATLDLPARVIVFFTKTAH